MHSQSSGCSSVRLEYTSGGREVAGSNPVIPTNQKACILQTASFFVILLTLSGKVMAMRIGVPELIVILIIALLIFGPKNLPKLGAAIGKTVKSVRDGMDGKNAEKAEGEEKPEPEE